MEQFIRTNKLLKIVVEVKNVLIKIIKEQETQYERPNSFRAFIIFIRSLTYVKKCFKKLK